MKASSASPDTPSPFPVRFPSFHLPLVSLVVVGALYLAALLSMPPEGLTEHDTGAKYLQVRNLRITPRGLDWSINYPARALDPDLQYVPFRQKQHYLDGDRIYLQWPIFLALLSRLPWKVLGFWGLYVVPFASGLGAAWAAYRLAVAVSLPRRVAWLALPLAGLATPLAVYSLLFFEHTLAAMLVTLSLWALVARAKHRHSEARPFIISGVLLAVAVWFRSELYVLALVVTGLLLWRALKREEGWSFRPVVVWLGAFVLALVPLWAFYAITDGSVLPLHAMWYFAPSETGGGAGGIELPAVRYLARAGLDAVPGFLFGPHGLPGSAEVPRSLEGAGLLGVAFCAFAALVRFVPALARTRLALMRYVLAGTGAIMVGIAALPALFSSEPYRNLHGFVLAAPFVVLALWPSHVQPGGKQQEGQEALRFLYEITLLYVALHFLIISTLSGLGPISRHEWGQRYLLPAYPLLVVLALASWGQLRDRLRTTRSSIARAQLLAPVMGGVLLAATGLGFNIRGALSLAEERKQVVAWQSLTTLLPDREPLVTDTWWLPLNLAPVFYTRPIMLAEGDEKLAAWANSMKGRGVTEFGYMTEDAARLRGAWTRQVKGIVPGGLVNREGMWLGVFKLGPP